MKKGLLIILAIVICFVVYLFLAREKPGNNGVEKEKPLAISRNSAGFNAAIQNVMDGYYKMHDALVNWDSVQAVDSIGRLLSSAVGGIPFKELKADTLLVHTAENYASAIAAECNAMQQETSIAEQRKSFYTISENLFDLLRTVQYDKGTIYHVLCPMAFNGNEEGYWLSDSREILNPYFGRKDPKHHETMLHCGSIEDSISFKQ